MTDHDALTRFPIPPQHHVYSRLNRDLKEDYIDQSWSSVEHARAVRASCLLQHCSGSQSPLLEASDSRHNRHRFHFLPAHCQQSRQPHTTPHHAVPLLPPAFRDRYIKLVSMDIQKWLDEIVQPETPPGTTKRKAPRKRSRSDSSLLGPRPPSPRPQQADSDGGTSKALHTTLSNCSTSSRYARKPRRKTRPELYEPGSRVLQRHKAKSKKTRHKRSKALPDMVQNFQAKNVSGDRLTVRCLCSNHRIFGHDTDDWRS